MTETIITVQGQHTARYAAELATLRLAVSFDGGKRSDVFDQANRTAEGLRARILTLHNENIGPVIRWSSDSVRVWGDRPWNSDGKQLPVVYHANIDFTATFSDFDALARFIEGEAETSGVSIGYLEWELTRENTETATVDVRSRAVLDAIVKAKTYAKALGLNTVTASAIADPGMLGNQTNASGGGIELASARAMMDVGGAPALSLKPQEIEVSVVVDARFVAS